MTDLGTLVSDFAQSLKAVDSGMPVAVNARSKVEFQPGIGPFSESKATALVIAHMAEFKPDLYANHTRDVPYPGLKRKRCDVCVGSPPSWDWCIEVKLMRLLGDNGKLNDNMLMHILSPYEEHRSALTDISKLLASGLEGRKAVLIYGFSHPQWPLEPAINAFEALAQARASIGPRQTSHFSDLVHPIHSAGGVFGWELLGGKGSE